MAGLADLAPLAEPLDGYQPFYAALADLNRRAGHAGEAADTYRRAIAASENDADTSDVSFPALDRCAPGQRAERHPLLR